MRENYFRGQPKKRDLPKEEIPKGEPLDCAFREPTPMTEAEAKEFYRETVSPKPNDEDGFPEIAFDKWFHHQMVSANPVLNIEEAARWGYAEGLKAGRGDLATAVKALKHVRNMAEVLTMRHIHIVNASRELANPKAAIEREIKKLDSILAAFDKGGADEA